jgi:sigma-B regulation protein RsbU (phosphoserine phosphatase)
MDGIGDPGEAARMTGLARAVQELVDSARHAGPEDLAGVAMRLAPLLGARDVLPYLVDYEQSTLIPLRGAGVPVRPPVPVEGTLPGRVFATGQALDVDGEDGYRLWLPMAGGTGRLGVLEVGIDAPPSTHEVDDLHVLAALFADVLAGRSAVGDAAERVRRRLPMQLAAEIVWSQLPPLAFASPAVAISGILEPCYDVGGDAFDYAVNDGVAHLAIFDTVGHGIAASALTSLAISAYRNARRCGLDLSDTYRSIDKWTHAQYPNSFVTGILAELDVTTGRYRRVCAGHPGELLLRGGRMVAELDTPTALPMGLSSLSPQPPRVEEITLEPRDLLLLYTDGVVEARTAEGEFFGLDRLVSFVTRGLADRLPAPETLRRLVGAVGAHQFDRLQDDATAVLLEWRPEVTYGGPPRRVRTSTGSR